MKNGDYFHTIVVNFGKKVLIFVTDSDRIDKIFEYTR